MKIDVFDGSITFDAGTIARKEDRTSFLRTAMGSTAKEEVVNPAEDWRHISLTPEAQVVATLIYQGERLHQILVSMAMPSDASNEWTAASELERKAMHDVWLRGELGKPPYHYAWGKVSSEFDDKGCASEIIITYAS